jgi:hypothetical protein
MIEGTNYVVDLYFDFNKKQDGKVFCKRCEKYLKDNPGHGNLATHVYNKHPSEYKEELTKHLAGPTRNNLGNYGVVITKIISPEAKDMFGWIEWIVMADLPIYNLENEYFRKRSNLKPTTYKTISKYMTKLLELVRLNIKGLPKTFGLIFDGIITIYLYIIISL